MPDLAVVALIKAKPGSEGVVRDALSGLVPPTRNEEGCLAYDLYESASESGTFVTVESWRGKDDLDAHMQTEHIKQVFAVAGDALAEAPAIHALIPLVVG